MGWTEFIAAMATFFASHAIPVRPAVKARIVAATSQRVFSIGYSLLSLAALIWLIGAAGRAPYVELWPWAEWHVHATLLGMFGVCLMMACAIGYPNPFSFGGSRTKLFDPQKPGLVGWMRHPLLNGLGVWAALHAFVNGTLAHVIVFGSFAIFAFVGQRAIDRRKQREMGANWVDLQERVADRAGAFWVFERGVLVRRLAAGCAAFAVLLILHPFLFGVSPLP